jgi:TolB-like protein/DNA-binding SARP family transcriptional activator
MREDAVGTRRLRLLGEFRLEDAAGRPVELRSRKARALLAYLALHPSGRETRERLAALLWGSMGDRRARANLRQAILDARAALADAAGQVLASAGDSLLLAFDSALEVDARRFRRLVAGDDTAGWAHAAELYRGELVSDLIVDEEPFDGWLTAQRRAFERAACRLFARLAEARRAAGDDDGAETILRRWLALDPACEEAHRALIALYAETDRRAAALAQFARCRQALADTFGVPPAPATLALHERLRAPTEPRVTPARSAAGPSGLGPLPLPPKPSLAVLPFENLSGPAESWLSEGIAEDVIVALSRFDGLMVIARQSSFVFRAQALDVKEIGRRLGVHYVLQGSVRRAGGHLRVAVQLADAGSGINVWAQRYDGVADDLFAVEDEITRTIVATLAGRVEADRLGRACRAPTSSLAAYDCLLKAKAHHHRFTERDNTIALKSLERALELAPDFALAHAWMACVIVQRTAFHPDPAAYDRGYAHASRARELEDGESECHRILAAYYLVRKRFADAERHQRRALELNPNDDRIVCQMGELLACRGRPDEGLPWIEQAMRLNPYHSDGMRSDYGRALYAAGRFAEALAALRRIDAPRDSHHAFMAACCVRLGDGGRAATHLAQARRLNPRFTPERFARDLPFELPSDTERLRADLERVPSGSG